MSIPPAVSIVIPNWEGERWLAQCVSSLQISARAARVPFEIIVVDDASSDTSVRILQKQFPRVRLLRNGTNRGFACTTNRGAAAARGDVLILCNNDIVAREGFVEGLTRWFRRPQTGAPLFAVSAKTVGWYDGKPNQLCMGAVWKGGRITPSWDDPKQVSPCLFAQAGAAAYDRKLFRQLGGLSRLFEPGYWEDYDLSWRAAKRGWKQLYDPEAFALHVGGGSMTQRFGADGVADMKAANHLLFELANLKSPRLVAEWCARLPLNLARDWPNAAKPGSFCRGWKLAQKRVGDALKARGKLQGRVSDEELLEPWRGFQPAY